MTCKKSCQLIYACKSFLSSKQPHVLGGATTADISIIFFSLEGAHDLKTQPYWRMKLSRFIHDMEISEGMLSWSSPGPRASTYCMHACRDLLAFCLDCVITSAPPIVVTTQWENVLEARFGCFFVTARFCTSDCSCNGLGLSARGCSKYDLCMLLCLCAIAGLRDICRYCKIFSFASTCCFGGKHTPTHCYGRPEYSYIWVRKSMLYPSQVMYKTTSANGVWELQWWCVWFLSHRVRGCDGTNWR